MTIPHLHHSHNITFTPPIYDVYLKYMYVLQMRKSILIASHNPDDVSMLSDTIHEMDAGVMTVVK